MKVSIIIPVYNGQTWLGPCLDSCVNQTYNDIEVIIINDGSIDATETIAKEYCDKYSNIFHYFYIENRGPSLARRYGLAKATSEFICFLDADDYLSKEAIQLLVINQQHNNKDIIIGQFDILFSDGSLRNIKTYKRTENSIIADYLWQNLPFTLWPNMYRKSILDKLHYPDQTVGEDFVLNCQIFSMKGLKIGIIDSVIYTHRKHAQSVTSNKTKEKEDQNFYAYIKGIEIIKSQNNKYLYERSLCFNMMVFYYSLIISRSEHLEQIKQEILEFSSWIRFKTFLLLKFKIKLILGFYYLFSDKILFLLKKFHI